MKNKDNGVLFSWILVVCMMLAVPAFWIAVSFFEAHAFNAATGKSVTTWQAMFISLRVQEEAK